MAPLWLEDVAHEAVSAALVLRVTQVEAPENGHLSRVCRHALYERPDEHEEEQVEDGEEEDHSPVVCNGTTQIIQNLGQRPTRGDLPSDLGSQTRKT